MPVFVRSALTTFVTAFVALVPLSAVVSRDFSWVQSAAVAAALATLRTIVAALDPGNPAYGIGSPVEVPVLDNEQPDAPIEGN